MVAGQADGFTRPVRDKGGCALHARRNFQGFTEDQSDVLIGLGASAISLFPGAIIQNEKNPGAYRDYISEGRLAGARGVRLALEDQRRGVLIEQLLYQLKARVDSDLVDPQLEAKLTHFVALGLVERAGDVLSITDQGRPYARNVAAAFDRHAAAHKIPPLVGKLS